MNVICCEKLYIKDPTKELLEFVGENLKLANPEFAKKEQLGKWTGGTPRFIYLYEKNGEYLILPFGLLKRVYNSFCVKGDKLYLKFANNGKRAFFSHIEPYDYQERVINAALKKKNGIIVMPCGAGKTQTALELVARLGRKTLWLTHTQDLLSQSMERAKSCFDLSESEYGTITDGKINIGNTITFATVQTLSNIDLPIYNLCWDVIIVDECHKCVGTPTNVMMFYKVLSNLSARYKIGLTATPERADGLETSMFALLGDKIDEVTRDEVKANTCEVRVDRRYTGYQPCEDTILSPSGTIVYASLIDDLITNESRNKRIADDLKQLDGTCLVLTDRLAHIDEIMRFMGDVSGIAKIDGKGAKKDRKTILEKLNKGEIKYLFATYKLAKEGLDIPTLRYVVFATPQKDYTTVAQSAGRVGRKADGKEYGTVIDYIDDFGLLYGYAKKRVSTYKKLNYNLIK